MHHLIRLAAWTLALTSLTAHAQVEPEVSPPEAPHLRYVLGLRLENGPTYFGQIDRSTGAHVLFALRYGRFRISNSGASSFLQDGGSGASADLLKGKRWRLSGGLRIDSGRDLSSDGRLGELPEVKRTFRGRIGLSFAETDSRSWTLGLAPDLGNRRGGTLLNLGVSQRLTAPAWLEPLGGQWGTFAGLTAGDATYMNSYFGVPVGNTRFVSYTPGAGLRNVSVGLGWQRSLDLNQRWFIFSGAGINRLLGPAADAPFIQRKSEWRANVGLAYRNQ